MAKRKSNKRTVLKTLFEAKQKSMLTDLGAIRKGVFHAPTMGNAGQKRWRELLSEYLPNRYQVDEAHIIDSDGNQSEQIDLVIFDRQYANLVINQDGILYVPAESVYAVCEIKQNITKNHLEYAGKKIGSARKLKRTSAPITQMNGLEVRKIAQPIIGCFIAVESDYTPAFGKAFAKNLNALKSNKKVDLVFSLEDGLYGGKLSATIGLVEFLYTLLERLQKMGNAPAINFSSYLKNLK